MVFSNFRELFINSEDSTAPVDGSEIPCVSGSEVIPAPIMPGSQSDFPPSVAGESESHFPGPLAPNCEESVKASES